MWFIKYDLNKEQNNTKVVGRLFKTKADAYTYVKLNFKNKNLQSNHEVLNAETTLVSDYIDIGSCINIVDKNDTYTYGVIEDISNHLVTVKKDKGLTYEFTKERINKELISGNFKILSKDKNLIEI